MYQINIGKIIWFLACVINVFGAHPGYVLIYHGVSLIPDCLQPGEWHPLEPLDRVKHVKIIEQNVTFQCQDMDDLLHKTLDVLLGKSFQMSCEKGRTCVQPDLAYFIIYAGNETAAKILKSITRQEPFLTITLPEKTIQIDDYSNYLYNVVNMLNWRKLIFISVHSGKPIIFQDYFEKTYQKLMATKNFHLKKILINIRNATFQKDLLPHIDTWLRGKSAIILFGPFQLEVLSSLDRYIDSRNQTFLIAHEQIYEQLYQNHIPTQPQKNWFSLDNLQRGKVRIYNVDSMKAAYSNLYNFLAHINIFLATGFLNKFANIYWINDNAMKLYIAWLAKRKVLFPDTFYEDYVTTLAEIVKRQNRTDRSKWVSLPTTIKDFSHPILLAPLNCTPGFRQIYGKIETTAKNIQSEHRMKCVLCPVNYIKPKYGNTPCVPCSGIQSVDNGYRTKCIDPYFNIYPSLDRNQQIVIISLSAFGVMLTITTLVIFVRYRNTPTVKVSDVVFSYLHLITICIAILFNCLVFIANFDHRTIEIAIAKCINLSVFYTANVAFVYTKSQKLIDAFCSIVQITGSEAKRTFAVQIFTVLIFLLFNNSVLYVTTIIENPEMNMILDDKNQVRYHFANTGFHLNVIIGFLVLFQMVCLVQSFRGRNLPGPMNDAMSLVYATMVTTMTLLVSFPIGYFRGIGDKDFLYCLIVASNCVVCVLFLYGKKCYVILFQSHKNTRRYFNEQSFSEVSQQIRN